MPTLIGKVSAHNRIWNPNTLAWDAMAQPVINTDTLTVSMAGVATQATLAALLTELQAKPDLAETQPVSIAATLTIKPAYGTRSDVFTGIATGTTHDTSTTPLRVFALQVKGTGAIPTLWTVVLEGSLDGTNFSTLMTHVTATGDGAVLWATGAAPVLYLRSRCTALTLGPATNITVTMLGVA